MVISPSYGMFGEAFYRADCGTEFSKASFLLRGKKKGRKGRKQQQSPGEQRLAYLMKAIRTLHSQ